MTGTVKGQPWPGGMTGEWIPEGWSIFFFFFSEIQLTHNIVFVFRVQHIDLIICCSQCFIEAKNS